MKNSSVGIENKIASMGKYFVFGWCFFSREFVGGFRNRQFCQILYFMDFPSTNGNYFDQLKKLSLGKCFSVDLWFLPADVNRESLSGKPDRFGRFHYRENPDELNCADTLFIHCLLTVTRASKMYSELINITFHNPSFGARAIYLNWRSVCLLRKESEEKWKWTSRVQNFQFIQLRYVDRHGSLKYPRSAYSWTKQQYSVLHRGSNEVRGREVPKYRAHWPQDLRTPRIDSQWSYLIFFPKLNQNDEACGYRLFLKLIIVDLSQITNYCGRHHNWSITEFFLWFLLY